MDDSVTLSNATLRFYEIKCALELRKREEAKKLEQFLDVYGRFRLNDIVKEAFELQAKLGPVDVKPPEPKK